jgi:molecular chaperone IbpA
MEMDKPKSVARGQLANLAKTMMRRSENIFEKSGRLGILLAFFKALKVFKNVLYSTQWSPRWGPRKGMLPAISLNLKRIFIMRTFDLTPLYRSAIGFDRLAQLLNDAQRNDSTPSYPPYNIELVSEDNYRIVMALAGFDRSEIDITFERDSLQVVGRKHRDGVERTYLHRGIAARDFEQRFQLANHVKVTGASFDNGMLSIELVREVPEALKPRKIEIGGNQNVTTLEQRQAA